LISNNEHFPEDKDIKKPIFRVENLPKKEDFDEEERRLLDEKIKEEPIKKKII
jgi:hypothetical protein